MMRSDRRDGKEIIPSHQNAIDVHKNNCKNHALDFVGKTMINGGLANTCKNESVR